MAWIKDSIRRFLWDLITHPTTIEDRGMDDQFILFISLITPPPPPPPFYLFNYPHPTPATPS